jgi:uncharacterized protein YgfB (UPF0149 family)
MSAPELPDFESTIRLSQGDLDAAELAECHGLLSGLLCREPGSTATDFRFQLSAMKLAVNPSAELESALTEAHACTVRQLGDEEFGFALWLPDDDEPLEERIIALGRWCSGFLAGLVCGGQLNALSEEATEAIEDLQQIAQAEMTSHSPDESESEEEEVAFAEIVEYVRVVALMMHEDFRGPGQHEAIH